MCFVVGEFRRDTSKSGRGRLDGVCVYNTDPLFGRNGSQKCDGPGMQMQTIRGVASHRKSYTRFVVCPVCLVVAARLGGRIVSVSMAAPNDGAEA